MGLLDELASAPGLAVVWTGAQPTVQLDRISSAGIVLGSSRFQTDERISRQHARIIWCGPHFEITDLNSRNGTYVDGQAIDRAVVVPGPSVLRTGRTVSVLLPDIRRLERTSNLPHQVPGLAEDSPIDLVHFIQDAVRRADPTLKIHATLIEHCLIRWDGNAGHLAAELTVAAQSVASQGQGTIRGEHLEAFIRVPSKFARCIVPRDTSKRPVPPARSSSELEALILEDLDARDNYLVYADYLQQRGDARGELVSVQLALEDRPDDTALKEREATLVAQTPEHLLGARGQRGRLKLTWRRGFVHTAMVVTSDVAATIELCKQLLPSTPFLRELALEACSAEVAVALGNLVIPSRLVRLALTIEPPAPNTEPDRYLSTLLELIAKASPDSMRRFSLGRSWVGGNLGYAIATSQILARLVYLDLSRAQLDPAEVDAILANAAAFQHLEVLDVRSNHIPAAIRTRLARACPRVELLIEGD